MYERVRSFRGAECDIDHYMVLAKIRERISVSKQTRQNLDSELFCLRRLDDVKVKEKYQVEISKRFAASVRLDESSDINNAWENIRENIKISAKDNLRYHRQKGNKPWFDNECSKLIEQRKQGKLQWLQNPSKVNGNNLEYLRLDQ
jgi:hypothetical protein